MVPHIGAFDLPSGPPGPAPIAGPGLAPPDRMDGSDVKSAGPSSANNL